MTGQSESSIDPETVQVPAFPEGLPPKSTILIAGPGEPAMSAVGLQALARYGHADDTGVVVTTATSVDETLDTYTTVCSEVDRPALALVDTVSEHQYVTAPYSDTPVVFVPAPTDLERIVMALSELTEYPPTSDGDRHLLIRSLTPLLTMTSTARVRTILDRITGLRTGTGRCFLGLDYTAHDESTMTTLIEQVDGVLWLTGSAEGSLDCDYRPANGRYERIPIETDSDD